MNTGGAERKGQDAIKGPRGAHSEMWISVAQTLLRGLNTQCLQPIRVSPGPRELGQGFPNVLPSPWPCRGDASRRPGHHPLP